MMTQTVHVDSIVLTESYVLRIQRVGVDVVFVMDLLLDDGQTSIGSLVFHDIKTEEWRTATGELTSLERLNEMAHRYSGGAEEPLDLGTINAIKFENHLCKVVGDWGECRFQLDQLPDLIIDELDSVNRSSADTLGSTGQ